MVLTANKRLMLTVNVSDMLTVNIAKFLYAFRNLAVFADLGPSMLSTC